MYVCVCECVHTCVRMYAWTRVSTTCNPPTQFPIVEQTTSQEINRLLKWGTICVAFHMCVHLLFVVTVKHEAVHVMHRRDKMLITHVNVLNISSL